MLFQPDNFLCIASTLTFNSSDTYTDNISARLHILSEPITLHDVASTSHTNFRQKPRHYTGKMFVAVISFTYDTYCIPTHTHTCMDVLEGRISSSSLSLSLLANNFGTRLSVCLSTRDFGFVVKPQRRRR